MEKNHFTFLHCAFSSIGETIEFQTGRCGETGWWSVKVLDCWDGMVASLWFGIPEIPSVLSKATNVIWQQGHWTVRKGSF